MGTSPGANPAAPRPTEPKVASRASSSCRSAKRLGILFPPAPKWVGAELVAKPAAPASSPSLSTACIRVISSGVAARS